MLTAKFGFIGVGNMGGALATAVCKAVGRENVMISDKLSGKAQVLADELGCFTCHSNEVAATASYIFLGVKPQAMELAVNEILPVLKARNDRFVLVTMAAGVRIANLRKMLGENYPIIRIMPNTPVAVGKGMILYSPADNVFMDEVSELCDALNFAGRLDKIDEAYIDAATAVSGCGPAFVYMFAEAMADAGVEIGLPRKKALEYAVQTLSGAAEMMIGTAKHPAQLKDDVCSPGGSTIAGVHALEEQGFRAGVMAGVKSAFDKTKDMSKA